MDHQERSRDSEEARREAAAEKVEEVDRARRERAGGAEHEDEQSDVPGRPDGTVPPED